MGASLSWFAIRDKTPAAALQDFGLKNAGKGYCDTPYCGGWLPSGWYLIIHGRHEFTNDEARRLSRGCEVVACFVEERVGVSRASGWNDGHQVWGVCYGDQAGDGLLVDGEPPAVFAQIQDRIRQEAEDESADFSIPVELARELTGYHHDETLGITLDNFVKPTFFQKLFGR